MLLAELNKARGDVGGDFIGLEMAGAGEIFKRGELAGVKAAEPLVAGFAADAVAVTQLRHGFACPAGEDEGVAW